MLVYNKSFEIEPHLSRVFLEWTDVFYFLSFADQC